MSSPVPVLSRDARLIKSSVAIGYGKSIKVSADAEEIKIYTWIRCSLQSPAPETNNDNMRKA